LLPTFDIHLDVVLTASVWIALQRDGHGLVSYASCVPATHCIADTTHSLDHSSPLSRLRDTGGQRVVAAHEQLKNCWLAAQT
jgi:hypothetical protein